MPRLRTRVPCFLAPGWPRIDGPEEIRAILKATQCNLLRLVRIKLANAESWLSDYGYRRLDFGTLFILKGPPGQLANGYLSSYIRLFVPFLETK